MVKQLEDEIPLTRSSPSITQETRARFDALLNAALKENKGPPKVFKRSNIQALKQKLDASKSSESNSINSQSDATSNGKTIDSNQSIHSTGKSHSERKSREVSAQIHTSRSNLISSSEEDIINTNKKKKKTKKSEKVKNIREKTYDKIESLEMSPLHDTRTDVSHVNEEERSMSRLSKRRRSYTLETSSVPVVYQENVPVISSPLREASGSRLSRRSYVIEKEQSSVKFLTRKFENTNSDFENKESPKTSRPSSRLSKRSYVIEKEPSVEFLTGNFENTNSNLEYKEIPKTSRPSSRLSEGSCVVDIESSEDFNSKNVPDDNGSVMRSHKILDKSEIHSSGLINPKGSSDSVPKTPVPLPRRKTMDKISIIEPEDIKSPIKLPISTPKHLMETRNDSASIDTDDFDEAESLARLKKKKRRRKSRTKETKEEEIEMKDMITPTQHSESSAHTTPGSQTSSRLSDTHTGEQILGITVHNSDYLNPEPTIKHPMVRVHIVDITSGEYLLKSCPERPVSFFNETSNFILPIMTHSFDFKEQRSLLPKWEELLVFNENLTHIVTASTLLLFEIVDFVNFALGSSRYRSLGSEGGWIKIAWAFLKLIAANGANNLDRKLRLQLFFPKNKKRKDAAPNSPLVYDWWSTGLRKKYPGTMYITVSGITPPQNPLLPSLRSRVVLQEEQGSAANLSSVSVVNSEDEQDTLNSYSQAQKEPDLITWSRLPGQSCKLPNTHLHCLPVGSCGSMNVRFSHSGFYLACGTSGDISVFSIPSAKLYSNLSGHQGLVYSVRWSKEDRLLVSASADCTVCVWDIRHKKSTPVQVLPHPSFVYCADYVPGCVHRVIVTGCRDTIVRLWYQHHPGPYKLTTEAVGHTGFVNALCFTKDNKYIISGDSEGSIRMWYIQDTGLCAMHEISVRELRGVTINNLITHPGGNRLLVHSRDSLLRMVDIATGAVIQWFRGCINERLQTGCCLTSCGGTVFACSEDGTICTWDSNTGSQTAMYMGVYTQGCVSVDYHPHEHMAVFSCYSPSLHLPVILTGYERSISGQDLGLKFLQPMQPQNEEDKVTTSEESIWDKLKNCNRQKDVINSNSEVSNDTSKDTTLKKKKKTIPGNKFSKADCIEATTILEKGVNDGSSLPQLTPSVNYSGEYDMCGVKDQRLLDIIHRMDKVLLAVKPLKQSTQT